jgi:16S rRNA (adenine1518-N6/adenine1519-N6)-dimethyltransferase
MAIFPASGSIKLMAKPHLTDPDFLHDYLDHHSITPARSAGQNFLVSPEVVEATVLAVHGGPKQVTELGAGLGPLTQGLAAAGYSIKAIERDPLLANLLPHAVTPKERLHLHVIQKDLREVDWAWPEPYQLVGNIPYNLSGLILRRVTFLDPAPERVVLLVQKEVGQRMTAQPPEMQLLGLSLQLWATTHLLLEVPRESFLPQPAVDSQLIMLVPHATPIENREAILQIAKIFFQNRRKQIGGVLKKQLKLSPEQVATLAATVGFSEQQRPQELGAAQWIDFEKHLPRL